MIFIELLQCCACIFILFLCLTQIIIPMCKGTKLFPMFLKEQKLKDKLVEVTQELSEQEIENEIQNLKTKLEINKKEKEVK